MLRAHRVSWELSIGTIPQGLHVLHSCDNPPCVNPAHLFLGTNDDNIADRHRKGRSRGGSLKGEAHPNSRLSAQDVLHIRNGLAAGESLYDMATHFGVTESHIWRIGKRKAWAHI